MSNLNGAGLSRLDRYTAFSELGDALHRMLRTGIPLIAIIAVVLVAKLLFQQEFGWLALAWIGAGTCFALVVWQSAGIGLPLLPLFAMQHLAVYGMPLVNRNDTITGYTPALIDQAGQEVMVLLAVCTITWRVGMQIFKPSPPKAHVFTAVVTKGNHVLNRIGIALIGVSAGYELLNIMHLNDTLLGVLPAGTQSIVTAIIGAAGMSGYFLSAIFIASGEARHFTRVSFWIILIVHLILLVSSILLSSVINIVGAVVLGFFWGSGRIPRMFLLVSCLVLSFLNVGKFEMRERYWDSAGQITNSVSLTSLPSYYLEWASYSADLLYGDTELHAKERQKQTMLARMDNLQNLLFVSNSVSVENTPVLGGETYAIIPPLLIPRILWPDKPRTHEGQIMLNVHFNRQSRADSLNTYVAWGLLPEAYGNFGPIWGAVILGAMLGWIFAWMENVTARKPLLSLEGMVTFALLIGIASSYEMVSSVLITSLFQSVTTISLACIPFVQNMSVIRPEEPDHEA